MKNGKDTVIVVSEFVTSSQNSTGYYWSGIINRLAEDFSKVKVVCASFSKPPKSNQQVRYIEIPALPYNEKQSVSLIGRLYTDMKLSWRFFNCARKSIDSNSILFTGTNPPILLLLIFLLGKVRSFRWVVLVHDVFPENMVAAGIISPANFFFKITKYFFDTVYASSDRIIVIGRDMKSLMEIKTKHQVESEYIPNWASLCDLEIIPRESSRFINDLNWSDKVVFQFFGNLGRVQDIPNILQAITLLKSTNAAFIFMGTGVMSEQLKDFISTHKELCIAFLGSINLKDKSEALSACDVAIVSLSRGMKGLGVPSKAYFSMAADKPILVISDEGSELDRVVDEFDVGWSCESGNPEALAKQIDNICDAGIPIERGYIQSIVKNHFSDHVSLGKISGVLQGF